MDGKAGPEIKEIRVLVKMFLMHILHNVTILYLNYYLSFDVCACFRLSVFLQKKFFRPKWIKFPKFGEQTSRILEFKPEGLEG